MWELVVFSFSCTFCGANYVNKNEISVKSHPSSRETDKLGYENEYAHFMVVRYYANTFTAYLDSCSKFVLTPTMTNKSFNFL